MKDKRQFEIAKKQYKKLANRPLSKERKKAVGSASVYMFIIVAIILIAIFMLMH